MYLVPAQAAHGTPGATAGVSPPVPAGEGGFAAAERPPRSEPPAANASPSKLSLRQALRPGGRGPWVLPGSAARCCRGTANRPLAPEGTPSANTLGHGPSR